MELVRPGCCWPEGHQLLQEEGWRGHFPLGQGPLEAFIPHSVGNFSRANVDNVIVILSVLMDSSTERWIIPKAISFQWSMFTE